MNFGLVMAELGSRLATISGLNVFDAPPDDAPSPWAVVNYPSTYTYDVTYGHGTDQLVLSVTVGVQWGEAVTARNQLGDYTAGSGAKSVKTCLESGIYTAFSVTAMHVTEASISQTTLGGTTYLAAKFNVTIAGQGA